MGRGRRFPATTFAGQVWLEPSERYNIWEPVDVEDAGSSTRLAQRQQHAGLLGPHLAEGHDCPIAGFTRTFHSRFYSRFTHNVHSEHVAYSNRSTVSGRNTDKGFEAGTVHASMGLHTKLSATCFGTILFVRYSICEGTCSVLDVGRVNRAQPIAGVFHPHWPPSLWLRIVVRAYSEPRLSEYRFG
jgi:hypothetical protein